MYEAAGKGVDGQTGQDRTDIDPFRETDVRHDFNDFTDLTT
jgi:hypothetical protein